MTLPLQTAFEGLDPTPALHEHIFTQASRVERLAPPRAKLRVVVDAPHRHHTKPAELRVRLELRAPGHSPAIVRRTTDEAEACYACIHEAFAALSRRLREDHERRVTGRARRRGAQAALLA